MTFIRSFSIVTERSRPFPYDIPAVRMAQNIALNPVTILVGDNGCGKSTLLETIACHLDLPLIGGYAKTGAGFEAARTLEPFLQLEWQRTTKAGFFFRAEDFSDFVKAVENTNRGIEGSLQELRGEVPDTVIREIRDNANYALRQVRKDYGEDLQAFSHGEAYLKILQTRVKDRGIFLLDEPEAALSPLKQLSLISFILDQLRGRNTQFIIATHSPIMMGIPEAQLYEIRDDNFSPVAYEETEHYQITRSFLENPQRYLRHF